jgi:signal transduction histidine kinase
VVPSDHARLDTALLHARQLDAAPNEAVTRLAEANDALLAYERSVFALARAGRLEESRAVLLGEGYAAQKHRYQEGVHAIDLALESRADEARLAAQQSRTLAATLFGASVLTMLVAGRTFSSRLSALREAHLRAEREAVQARERATLAAMVADIGLLHGGPTLFRGSASGLRLLGLDRPADTPLARSELPPALGAALAATTDLSQPLDLRLEMPDRRSLLVRGRASRDRFDVAIIDVTAQAEAERSIRRLADDLEARVRARTTELEEQVSHNRLLALQVAEAETAERRRVANLLHEDLQQHLVALRLHIVSGAPALQLEQIADRAIQVSRTLATDLIPASEDRDLADALADVCALFRRWHHLDVYFEARDRPQAVRAHIDICHSVVRELLFNVVKHAGGAKASVFLSSTEDAARVLVCDDGPGFDRDGPSGMGLPGIHRRTAAIGGSIRIDARPGQGARIEVRIPLQSSYPAKAGPTAGTDV